MPSLAERLQRAMSRAQMSQAELARRCHVSQPSVHGWLSGKSKFLRGENLLAAAGALDVSQQWLATGHGSMTIDNAEAPKPDALDPVVELRIVLTLAAQALADSIPAAGRELARALERQPALRNSEFAQTVLDTIRDELGPRKAPERAQRAAGAHKRP